MISLSTVGAGGNDKKGMSMVLPEETVCLKIVENAESWLLNTKKIMQGNSFTSSEITKGTPLDTIRELYCEGCSIPVNFDYEMRPLKAALRNARDWTQEHEALLILLGIRKYGASKSASTAGSSSSGNSNGGSTSARQSTCPGGEGEGEVDAHVNDIRGELLGPGDENGKNLVTYEQLFSCVSAGAHLSADFSDLRYVISTILALYNWQSRLSAFYNYIIIVSYP